MKKIIAFTISLIMMLAPCLNIAYASSDSTINNVTVNANSAGGQVTVQGNISAGSGKEVTLQVLDPDGSEDYIGQTTSLMEGSFIFTFTSRSVKDGNYTVKVGGEGVGTPYQQTFTFSSTAQKPAVPTGLKAKAVNSDKIELSWSAAAGAAGYNVYISNTADGVYTKLNSEPFTAVTYNSTGLSAGTTYYYEVTAVNSAGESDRSSSVSATTQSNSKDDDNPGNTTGGSSNNPSSVTIPVTTTTDGNSSVIATIDASYINTNSTNVINVQATDANSGVMVRIPVGAMGSGTGSLSINAGTVVFDMPLSVLASSTLASGTTLQFSQRVLSEADASTLLANIPQGAKASRRVFTFSLDLCDSNNNVVSSIHNFAGGKSVAVTLKLTSDDIQGMDTSNISAFYYDTTTNSWVDVGGSFNAGAMTYSFTTPHFTNFTILEKPVSGSVKRLAGQNRIETSIAIAKEQYSSKKPDAVVLTTANDFPDALTGSGIAFKYNAPLLLVNKSVSDSKNVMDYITGNLNKDKNVYVLGGTAAVSEDITGYLKGQGYNIVRISGKNRYETNQSIFDNLNVAKGTPFVITTGESFADALSMSSIADIKGYPVLLNGKDELSANVVSNIKNIQPSTIYIAGGTGVLSASLETQIKGINSSINIVRLGGKDRYETSMIILDYFKLSTDTVTVATGIDFPDALSGSVLAARKNSGVLLVDNKDVTRQKALLTKQNITKEIVLGGEAVISNGTANSLIQR